MVDYISAVCGSSLEVFLVLREGPDLNPKQVQQWLGHHAASFTLDVSVRLLADGIAEALAALDTLLEGDKGASGASEPPAAAVQAVSTG